MKNFDRPLADELDKSGKEEADAALIEVNASINECEQELARIEIEIEQIDKDLAVDAISREQAEREKASLQEHWGKARSLLADYLRMREEFAALREGFVDMQKKQTAAIINAVDRSKN